MWKLRNRPPVFSGHKPPIVTHSTRIDTCFPPDGAHHVRWRFAFAKNPLPDLEVDEQPQAFTVIGGAPAVLFCQLPSSRLTEDPPLPRTSSKDELLHDRPELTAKPAAQRHRK